MVEVMFAVAMCFNARCEIVGQPMADRERCVAEASAREAQHLFKGRLHFSCVQREIAVWSPVDMR